MSIDAEVRKANAALPGRYYIHRLELARDDNGYTGRWAAHLEQAGDDEDLEELRAPQWDVAVINAVEIAVTITGYLDRDEVIPAIDGDEA